MRVLVGTCGFSRSRRLIFRDLDAVEVQQTFYDPPESKTLQRLRSEAPPGFEFTMKAWMLVTHPYNRMLWKRLKRSVPGDPGRYGYFQDTEEVWWAWSETLRAARDLDASIIVLQTPASFSYTQENFARITSFLERADRGGRRIAWEPRGDWWSHPEVLASIEEKYDIIIAGDFLRGRLSPCKSSARTGYARLHGLGGREVNYKYKYTDDDLNKLRNIISRLDCDSVYVMFNNVYSYDDAVRFKRLLKGPDK